MKIILLVCCVLGIGACHNISSDKFGNLLVKYVKNETDNSELQIINDVFKISRASSNNPDGEDITLKCFICRSKFSALFHLIHDGVPDTVIMSKAIYLCSLVQPSLNFCRGFVELNFPILKYIIANTPKATPEIFCELRLQDNHRKNPCAYTDERFEWQVKLPPKSSLGTNKYKFNKDTANFTVALISDIHIDPYYNPNSIADCNEPSCCRADQKPRNFYYKTEINKIINKSVKEVDGTIKVDLDAISKVDVDSFIVKYNNTSPLAGYWGDYRNCDTPTWTYSDVIDRIATHKDIDAVYYTGDNVDHHYWETTYELNDKVSTLIIDKMKKAFGKNITVVPALGNHEAQPAYQFAPNSVKGEVLNTTWLYENLAAKWSYFIDTSLFRQRGVFSLLIRPGLRVISLNNIVASNMNWWLVYDPLIAKRHLEWLVQELHTAELAGERVHIISHIPPGHKRLTYTWTREYYRIIERFSTTISAQFTGHSHRDELKLFYENNSDEIFSVAWGIGSIITKESLNSNYKIATFGKTYEPLNIVAYSYNLTEANLTPEKPPRWYKLYDMISDFELPNLSPQSMNALFYKMVSNENNLLDLYIAYTYRLSDTRPQCDEKCKYKELCNVVTTVLWDKKKCKEIKLNSTMSRKYV